MIRIASPPMMMAKKMENCDCAGPRIMKNNAFNNKQSFNSIGNTSFLIHPQFPPEPNSVNSNDKSIKDNITRIIMVQDTTEGFLRENEEN